MRTTKLVYLALSALLALTLWGCGSNRDSGGNQTTAEAGTFGTDSTGVKFVGAGICIGCHQDFTWSAEAVQAYLGSKHVMHSTHINAASGDTCLGCHDPIGDSKTIEPYFQDFLVANPELLAAYVKANGEGPIPATGLAAIGCENCHGAGGQHYGIGPIPTATPDYNACGQCHNANFDHNSHHPYADNIVENYKMSGHINSIETAHGTPAELRARCARCHSDEGFRLYAPETVGLDSDGLKAALDSKAPLTNVSPVQCRTCHDPHSGELRANATTTNVDDDGDAATPRVAKVSFSASFNLCISCHMNFLTATWDQPAGKFTYRQTAGKVLQHSGAGTQGHFDDPATPEVEGFNINAADENACLNCHDPHGATKFAQPFAAGIAEEWGQAKGFHGDYKGPAFDHGCTPCHSPLGLVELTQGAAYSEVDTEVGAIGCVACHDLQQKNAAGTAFELGSRRSVEFAFDNARTIYAQEVAANNSGASLETVQGVEDNALCLTCHSGRESTASVDDKIAASAGPYSFTNIHYLAAGATLFGTQAKGAYEYAGKSYSSKFEHVASNDLCVECHNAHSGELYLTSPGFGPSGCDSCHSVVASTGDYESDVLAVRDIRMAGSFVDYDGDGNNTEGMYYEVAGMIAKLEATLNADGLLYRPASYPYFFPVGTTVFERTNAAKLTAKQLRAAYNLQVASKDPGAYAHNGTYIIEILYDSIEDIGGAAAVAGLTRDASGHFDAAGEPFRHWDGDGEMSTSCAKCHSSEGAAAFFTNGTVTTADFTEYTKGISAGLSCEACHTAPFEGGAASPARRQPTEVTFPSGVVLDASNAAPFFADDSKLCMTCHQGRESMNTVDSKIAAGSFGFTNIHYFAAAASFFGDEVKGGYQYAGKTYVGRMSFPAQHANFGFTTCAGCHMADAPTHDFKPEVTKFCAGCHGFAGTGTEAKDLGLGINSNYNDIIALKDQLLEVIEASGVTALSGYPYFSGISNAAQLKAAYNWQVADKEPCGYIHNPDYIKQLLHDAIVDLSAGAVTPVVTRP